MYSAYLVLFGVLPVRICMLSLWSFLHIGVGFWRCLFNFDRQLQEPQCVERTTDDSTLFLCS